jgi:molybdopterin converting factor small subunit
MAQPSLFGPSVAETQLAIEQQDQQNVRQGRTGWAGVADIGITSAQRAARSLGGLFGIEDPRLKEAAQQEAIFKELKDSGVDFTDSEQLYPALINAYQSRGMIDKAIVAAAKLEDIKATKLKSEAEIGLKGAQATKALADARKALTENLPTVPKLQKLRDDLRAARPNAESDQQLAEIDQKLKELDSAINKESTFAPLAAPKPESFGVDREAISRDMYGKRFGDLTQQEQQAVNKRVLDESKMRQSNTNITLSTPENAALIGRFETSIKPIFDKVSAIDSSITLIKKGTPFSEAALRQEISSIFGDANKAKTEIEALANTGSLDQRIANRITQFINGKDTKVTNEDRLAVLLALREKEKAQYERRRTPYVNAAKASNVDAPNIFPNFDAAFGTAPGVAPSGTITGTTSTGTEYRVVKRGN